MSQSEQDGNSFLIQFLQQFTGLMGKQLNEVRKVMNCTVEEVMEGVNAISSESQSKRDLAEQRLESTYLNPDAETQVLVDDLQKMVSDIFDKAKDHIEHGTSLDELESADPEILLQNRLNRFDGKFMKDMSNLPQMDDHLKNLLLGIMGALSSEDVIAQRLDHIIMALKVLQTGLNYVLIDYESRCNVAELDKVTTDIRNYTYRQYTTEDEKNDFFEFFPEEKRRLGA